MKFSILAITALLPTLASGYTVRGFDAFGRPVTIRGMGQPTTTTTTTPPFAAQRREAFRRQAQQKRAVDQAFEDLMNDLNQPASEKVISKSKEWVDRSFLLFSELNRDVAPSQDEIERNEELLQKQQKWANKFIDFAAELGQDLSSIDPRIKVSGNGGRSSDGEDQEQKTAGAPGTTTVPLYSIKDDATVFEVELELPSVSLDDIDLELDKETNVLTISGQRKTLGSAEPIKFSKSFMLESNVDTQNISAKMNNGILTITAPKQPKNQNDDKTKKIPVVSAE